ncbi:MAG: hypothetical protein LUE92_04915 [Clostridiales bacterium]|nr:hypothetical protein [Clostridiales bacterium]
MAVANVYGLSTIASSIPQSETAIGIYSAVPGIGGFVTPFILSAVLGALSGSFLTNLWVGAVVLIAAAILSVYVMNRAEKTKVSIIN